MKKLALTAALLLLFVPVSARAFSTLSDNDLLAFVEMPLAVDMVADTRGVDLVQLASLCANLNEANVPPTVFVQELRYTPVALVTPAVERHGRPTLVSYVREQRRRGVTGYALGEAVRHCLTEQYYVTPVVEERRVIIVDDNYIPPVVVTRVTELVPDPLAFIDMPLVVADNTLPYDQLVPLVTSLNQAYMPPAQFVRVVSYAPVAQPDFVPFVQTQVAQGVSGPALVSSINQRLPIAAATTSYTTSNVASSNVASSSTHPHGGPPGQLKRTYGYQTGAEVVHGGSKPGRQFVTQPAVVAAPPPRVVHQHGHGNGNPHAGGRGHGHGRSFVAAPQPQQPVFVPQPMPQVQPQQGHGRGPQGFGPPGQMKGGNGHGNGHGKGHGKD